MKWKCKNQCPHKTEEYNYCCVTCLAQDAPADCKDFCKRDPAMCGESIPDVGSEDGALAAFGQQQISALESIAALIQRKKDLDKQEAELKAQLLTAMETFGVKKFTNDLLSITYVAPTTAESVDSAKLKAKYPEIAAECMKTSSRKAYVKVDLKGDNK